MCSKKCRICGTEKTASEFYRRNDSGNLRSECKECMIEKGRFKMSGWTTNDYDKAMHEQGGKCAICHTKLNSSRYTKLCADHNHKTGEIRGLLCVNCNTAIGLLRESPIVMRSAIAYIEQHNS